MQYSGCLLTCTVLIEQKYLGSGARGSAALCFFMMAIIMNTLLVSMGTLVICLKLHSSSLLLYVELGRTMTILPSYDLGCCGACTGVYTGVGTSAS